ncbi:MAG TPA: hypothetical protein PKD54_08840 [Pirellulaceae bacterium]|nr:hypothetical protein [Pirellulaceae bacterium]
MSDLEYEAPDDSRLLSEYRQFSGWAVIAVIAGLISCLSLLESWLFFLGIGGAVVSLIALFDILGPKRHKAGMNLALVALFLSLFSATASYVHHQLARQRIVSIARQYGELWLNQVKANDPYRSYELTLEYPKRQPADTDLQLYYEGKTSLVTARDHHQSVFQSYLVQEPEKSIRAAGDQFQFQFFEFERLVKEVKVERYFISFWGDFPEEPKRRKFGLEMRRTHYLPPINIQWNVASIYSIDPYVERKHMVPIVEGQDFTTYSDDTGPPVKPNN